MSSDSDIIRQSSTAPAAFAEIYDRHAGSIYRYAARRVGVTAADDIMSETFLVAFQRRSAFDHERLDARPWLFGIATVLLKKHTRREIAAWKGMAAGEAAEVRHDVIDNLSDRLDAASSIGELATAIRRLPSRDRDTLLLYAWGDLDYEGVAQALGVPVGTVRSRLNRARRILRAASQRGMAATQEVDHGRADTAPQGA